MKRLATRKWMVTHAFVVAVVLLFLVLGRWQLQRAETGNTLSWAYAMEWPTFALMVVGFWIKIMRDELHPKADDKNAEVSQARGAGRGEEDSDLAAYNRYIADLATRRVQR